jgi:hypothetical protein
MSVSKMSGQKATNLLQLWSCKTLIVHALKEHDPVARIHFCNWFLRSVYDGEVDPQLVFFLNEAWFSLMERRILRTGGTEVQKTQDLFMNTSSSWWENWCLVCDECMLSDINNFWPRIAENKQCAPLVYWVHSVRMTPISASSVALASFY